MHSSTAEESDRHGPHTSSGLSGRRGGGRKQEKNKTHMYIRTPAITKDTHLVDYWMDG